MLIFVDNFHIAILVTDTCICFVTLPIADTADRYPIADPIVSTVQAMR